MGVAHVCGMSGNVAIATHVTHAAMNARKGRRELRGETADGDRPPFVAIALDGDAGDSLHQLPFGASRCGAPLFAYGACGTGMMRR